MYLEFVSPPQKKNQCKSKCKSEFDRLKKVGKKRIIQIRRNYSDAKSMLNVSVLINFIISLFDSYYTEVLGRALLLSLDCSTLLLIRTLYCWVLSRELSSTIFKVFDMTRPGIEPRSLRPLANILPTRNSRNGTYLILMFKRYVSRVNWSMQGRK